MCHSQNNIHNTHNFKNKKKTVKSNVCRLWLLVIETFLLCYPRTFCLCVDNPIKVVSVRSCFVMYDVQC